MRMERLKPQTTSGRAFRRAALRKLSRPQLYVLSEIVKRCPRDWRVSLANFFSRFDVREKVLIKFPTVPTADVFDAVDALHAAFENDLVHIQQMREENFSTQSGLSRKSNQQHSVLLSRPGDFKNIRKA